MRGMGKFIYKYFEILSILRFSIFDHLPSSNQPGHSLNSPKMHFLQYLAAVPLLLTPLSSALPTQSSEVTESPALTSYLRSVEARQALSTTENGLSAACKAVTFIFARGTNEDGNVGTIAGPPLFAALRSSLGAAAINFQGVTYAANVFGYLVGGDPAGSTEMLRLINLAATQCPSTKLVIGGYSQGAQLVHKAADKLTAAVTARVAAGE